MIRLRNSDPDRCQRGGLGKRLFDFALWKEGIGNPANQKVYTDAVSRMRNVFGNADRVQCNASMGHKTSNTFRLEGSQPLAFGSPVRFTLAAFKTNANNTKYSSFRERQRGMSLALTNISDGESSHELWYEAAWRTVALDKGSLVCAPEEAGDSFKSAIRHVYTYDTRHDPRMPEVCGAWPVPCVPVCFFARASSRAASWAISALSLCISLSLSPPPFLFSLSVFFSL